VTWEGRGNERSAFPVFQEKRCRWTLSSTGRKEKKGELDSLIGKGGEKKLEKRRHPDNLTHRGRKGKRKLCDPFGKKKREEEKKKRPEFDLSPKKRREEGSGNPVRLKEGKNRGKLDSNPQKKGGKKSKKIRQRGGKKASKNASRSYYRERG